MQILRSEKILFLVCHDANSIAKISVFVMDRSLVVGSLRPVLKITTAFGKETAKIDSSDLALPNGLNFNEKVEMMLMR